MSVNDKKLDKALEGATHNYIESYITLGVPLEKAIEMLEEIVRVACQQQREQGCPNA